MRTTLVRSLVRSLAVALLVALAGCADPSVGPRVPELRFARAMRGCGPTDGPAVFVFLSAMPMAPDVHPAAGTVLVAIHQPLERVAHRGWEVGDDGDAWVNRWLDLGRIESATGGTVAITAVRADRTVEGFVDVRFPDRARLRQAFRAPWQETAMLCG